MKKIYFSPEAEELLLEIDQPLLAGSEEQDDITDGPVPTVEDPTDDDLDW